MTLEKKTLLSGEVKTFACQLVHLQEGFGVLQYVIDQSYDISGVKLRPGDITLALYWTDRPYTLYIWYLNKGTEVAYYFNIADQIALQPLEFAWRDLVVDVLIDPQNKVHVLDEHELPADLSPELANYIQSTKELILRDYQKIIQDANDVLNSPLFTQ